MVGYLLQAGLPSGFKLLCVDIIAIPGTSDAERLFNRIDRVGAIALRNVCDECPFQHRINIARLILATESARS
jgi:hypothetical protein